MYYCLRSACDRGSRGRKRVYMFGQEVSCARSLVAREIARCVKHVEQMGWERAFSSRVPMFCMACISSTRAMRVRAGIMTGLHLQSADLFVQGSELYSRIGIFQSSASARTSDLPTNIPNSCTNDCSASTTPAVGPRRPFWF